MATRNADSSDIVEVKNRFRLLFGAERQRNGHQDLNKLLVVALQLLEACGRSKARAAECEGRSMKLQRVKAAYSSVQGLYDPRKSKVDPVDLSQFSAVNKL